MALKPNMVEALVSEREGLEARLESGEGDPKMLKRRIGEVGDQLGDQDPRPAASARKASAAKESRPAE